MSATTSEVATAVSEAEIAELTVYENGVPRGAQTPYVAVWGGVSTPDARTLSGAARQSSGLWQAVCVSNTLTGVRLIAAAVVDSVDGVRIGGGICTCPFVSTPQKDTSDPSGIAWTVTIDITQKGAR